MLDNRLRKFHLAGPKGDGRRPYLDERGVHHGDGTPLLERDAFGVWRPRPQNVLEKVLSAGYGCEIDLDRRMLNLEAGFGRTLNQCVRGMVSQRCGGNAVKW